MPKHSESAKHEADKSETGARPFTREDLPESLRNSLPPKTLAGLEKNFTYEEMKPGTARARIRIKDPVFKKTYSKGSPLEESWKNKRRWPEEETD